MNLSRLDLLKIRMLEDVLGEPLSSHSSTVWLNLAEIAEAFGEKDKMDMYMLAAIYMETYSGFNIFVPMNEKTWKIENSKIKDPPRRKKAVKKLK